MTKYKGSGEDDKLLKEIGVNPNTLKFTPDSYTLDKNGKIVAIKLGSAQGKAEGGKIGTHKTKSGKTAKKGLYYNINQKKKAGDSATKKKSSISPKAYANMQAGFPKKKKKV